MTFLVVAQRHNYYREGDGEVREGNGEVREGYGEVGEGDGEVEGEAGKWEERMEGGGRGRGR